jgi:hypothetical protein
VLKVLIVLVVIGAILYVFDLLFDATSIASFESHRPVTGVHVVVVESHPIAYGRL